MGTGRPGVSVPPHSPFSPQTYVVKVQRESPSEVVFVQRTFEEFQELHNKLRLLFPSSLLPRYPLRPYTRAGGLPMPPGVTEGPWPHGSFPSRFVIGRSRGEAVAERRKEELNGYIWHLIHAAPEVAEVRGRGTPGGGDGGAGERNLGGKGVNAVRKASVCAPWVLGDVVTGTGPSLPRSATSSTPSSTHCRGMRRQLAPARHQNQQVGGLGCTPHPPLCPSRVPPTSLPCPFSSPDATWARPLGKVGGEVKLSISYKNNKLFIMVMHIRGLVGAQRPGGAGAGSAGGAGLTACPVLCPAAAPPGWQ